MGVLLIKCPRTSKTFSSGIQTDAESLGMLPQVLTRSQCPHCAAVHSWWTSEAMLVDSVPPSDWIENQK